MMHRITNFMYTLHRVLGTLWCLVFLCWFLSAFVMLYHRFPHVSEKEKQTMLEVIVQDGQEASALPSLEELRTEFPKGKAISPVLSRQLGVTKLQVATREGKKEMVLDGEAPKSDADAMRQWAESWCKAPVAHIDTLTTLDRWTPFAELKEELPFYKFCFNDTCQTAVYFGSKSHEMIQCTTRAERFWSYLGAIPHWGYLVWLRQNQQLWERTMILLTALGCLMLLAGGWVTVDVWRRSRNKKGLRSPYKKCWYHWHYVSGIVFGIFMLTFTFSGLVYVAGIPQWVHRSAFTHSPQRQLRADKPTLTDYALDYRDVLRAYPKAKRVEWNNFRHHPYYTVTEGRKTHYVDATDTIPQPLSLTEDEVLAGVAAIYQSDSAFLASQPRLKIELCREFETYYRNISHQPQPQLPVYKVTAEDPDGSVFYVQPQTGVVRYVDKTARIKYWCYTALHRFRFGELNNNGTLRKAILLLVLAGGTVVCVTGVALSCHYLRRKSRKINNQIIKKKHETQ